MRYSSGSSWIASVIRSSTIESKKSPSGSIPTSDYHTGFTGEAPGPVRPMFSETISSCRCDRSRLRRKTLRQIVKSQLFAAVPRVY